MVRRGSTVRVRQRALQNPRSRGFFVQRDLQAQQRAVGMEPFMELSRRERSLRRLIETHTADAGQSYTRSVASRAELSSSLMRSSIPDSKSSLLAPLSVGDRLPWKLNHEGEPQWLV